MPLEYSENDPNPYQELKKELAKTAVISQEFKNQIIAYMSWGMQYSRDITRARENEKKAQVDARGLLREAYNRLMVSEGDARYIDANIELANRIAEAVDVEAREAGVGS